MFNLRIHEIDPTGVFVPNMHPGKLHEPQAVTWEISWTQAQRQAFAYGYAGSMDVLGHYQGPQLSAWTSGVLEGRFDKGLIK